MNRFTVQTIVDSVYPPKYSYLIIGPWGEVNTSHGPNTMTDIIEAWSICDELNELLGV